MQYSAHVLSGKDVFPQLWAKAVTYFTNLLQDLIPP